MGLTNGVVLKGDIEYSGAYVNIRSYVIDKFGKRLTVNFAAYKSEDEFLAGKEPLILDRPTLFYRVVGDEYQTYFSDSVLLEAGVSIEKQIYTYLRTEHTETFSEFIDVL